MSHPITGPDDRSPTARRDERITNVSEWLANALGVESLTANEQDVADYIERLRNEVVAGRRELEESVSALRSVRRDAERLDGVEHYERAIEYTGEEVKPWRVSTGYQIPQGRTWAYAETLREAIDVAIPQ